MSRPAAHHEKDGLGVIRQDRHIQPLESRSDMYQNTNPSSPTPSTPNPYGIGFTGTGCRGYDHDHSIPANTVKVTVTVSMAQLPTPVRTIRGDDGQLYRRFGLINYWPATGHMHISARPGALGSEIDALFATAETPKQDPSTWPVHPCQPEQRRISLYRPIDDDYLAEAAAVMFEDLERVEQIDVVASWSEGLTNA